MNVWGRICYMHDQVSQRWNLHPLRDVDVRKQLNLIGTSGYRRHTVAWKVVLRLSSFHITACSATTSWSSNIIHTTCLIDLFANQLISRRHRLPGGPCHWGHSTVTVRYLHVCNWHLHNLAQYYLFTFHGHILPQEGQAIWLYCTTALCDLI